MRELDGSKRRRVSVGHGLGEGRIVSAVELKGDWRSSSSMRFRQERGYQNPSR